MKVEQQKPFSYRLRLVGVQVCPESTDHRIRVLNQGVSVVIEHPKTMFITRGRTNFNLEQSNLSVLVRQAMYQIPIALRISQLRAPSPAVSSPEAYTTPAR